MITVPSYASEALVNQGKDREGTRIRDPGTREGKRKMNIEKPAGTILNKSFLIEKE